MSELYLRKVEVIAGSRKFNNDDFTIYFDIPFDDGPDANIAEIEVYNIMDETIAEIKKGSKVFVNAGYKGNIGAILIGEARRIETDWQRPEKITTVVVLDANDDWMGMDIKKTYKEGITAKQILNDLLPKTGLKVAALKLPVNKIYTGAKTIDDKIGKAVVEIAKDCGAKIHVNKGKIFIREKSEGDKTGFLLDAAHGLIGSPTPIEKEEKLPTKNDDIKGKKVTRKGWKVTALLNHNFATDAVIKVKSKTANGFFRIEKGNHISNGSSYYTEMEVFPL